MIPIARNVEKCNFEKIEKNLPLKNLGNFQSSPIYVLSLIFKCTVVSDWQASLKFHYSNTCNIEVFNNRLNFYR